MSKESLVNSANGVRVFWEANTSDGGIKLTGADVLKKSGVIINILPLPSPSNPNQALPCAFVAGDDKKWHIIPLDACQIE